MMRCSLDKVLLDARQLANKIRATDETADMLIKQASDAHNKIVAKRQCQEEITSFEQLNQISASRPRSRLMMCIAAENKQLEVLRQENKVLRTSLNEYEITLEMIMKKFRKHKDIMKKLDQLDRGGSTKRFWRGLSSPVETHCSREDNSSLILFSKITRLQKAIANALAADNHITDNLGELETQLLLENQELRRLIEINEEFKSDIVKSSQEMFGPYNSVVSYTSENGCLRATCNMKPESTNPNPSSHTVSSPILPSNNNSIVLDMTTPLVNGKLKDSTYHSVQCSKLARIVKLPPTTLSTKMSSNDIYGNSSPMSVAFSNDDDDHSSVASDTSVKTLI